MADRSPLLGPDGKPLVNDDGFLLKHYRTFSAVWNALSRTYRFDWDEAYRHSRTNALAMRNDCFLTSLMFERKNACAQLPWHLEPEDPKDAVQAVVADELTKVLKRTPNWQRLMMTCLEALWYGRYGAQLVWSPGVVIGGMPRLAVTRHIPVNGDKIHYRFEGVPCVYVNAGEVKNLQEEYKANIVYGDRAPLLVLDSPYWRERFLIHAHEVDDADYFDGQSAGGVHGVGIRHRVYWAWWLRNEFLSWMTDYMQKVGTLGLLLFFYEHGNADARAAAEQSAAEASDKNALAVPVWPSGGRESAGAELLPASTAGVEALRGIIADYFERHIERLIVGQSMSAGADNESGLGGSGRAQFAQDTKHNILKFDAQNLGETLTTDFVMVAQKWNFPEATWQTRLVFDVPDPEAGERLEAAGKVAAMGLPVKAEEIYGASGLSKPGPDDEVAGGGTGLGGEFGMGEDGDTDEPEPAAEPYQAPTLPVVYERPEPDEREPVTINVHMPEKFEFPAPQITVNVPEQPAPVVNVAVPEQAAPVVHVAAAAAPNVTVMAPEQMTPRVTVNVPAQAAPVVTVNVPEQPAPQVTVNTPAQAEFDVVVERDGRGIAKRLTRVPKGTT